MVDSHCKKMSTSFVHPLRCTKQAAKEGIILNIEKIKKKLFSLDSKKKKKKGCSLDSQGWMQP